MANVLVTGIAGGLARRVAERLLGRGDDVVGVDYRAAEPPAGPGFERLTVLRASYNKTSIEDVFRHRRFDAVLHLGRVGNLKESFGKRFDLNVVGTQKIMNLCVAHGVRRLVVLSTFHIYGAHPSNHIPIHEDEPLRAGVEFPQIADAIQLDNMASTWVYRHPEVATVVLRPTNVVGPTLQNTMSRLLRARRAPYVFGFNPMTQFVDEDDLADAVLAAASGGRPGVFNVAGPGALPWREALGFVGSKPYPVVPALARAYSMAVAGPPPYLLRFLMHPCVVSDAAFRAAFGWEPRVSLREALARCAAGPRAGGEARRATDVGAS
ncbi:MAG TPA: NAD-dependent epimerase/dehydratase family protein [Polyangiaceae bacterium]|nr:NAD-dependent epimerase/dehydratase family protein [Polyangiaceae bacterium]